MCNTIAKTREGFTMPSTCNKQGGRGNPFFRVGEKSPLPLVAFLCLSFLAVLCRLFIMAGCFGKSLRLAAPTRGISTPLQPVAHTVESISGGYFLLELEYPL
jgi:hypothetical protein